MEKILISGCLIGDKTRYDGRSNYTPLYKELLQYYELVPFCPEVEGGLSTPRQPSEIKDDKVIMNNGKDVTDNFNLGAEKAYNICLYLGINKAILKENSPSCGTHKIHDGSFNGKLIDGQGITAKYLAKKGIQVYSENDIEELVEAKKNG